MIRPRLILSSFFAAVIVTGCGRPDRHPPPVLKFYVTVAPGDASKFVKDILELSGRIGFNGTFGTATDEKSRITFVVDARNSRSRLVSMNIVLSAEEAERCGLGYDMQTDELHHVVTLEPLQFDSATAPVMNDGKQLQEMLESLGYPVSAQVPTCESAHKASSVIARTCCRGI